MLSTGTVLLLVHLIGLALCVGAATAKVVLLLKCYREITFVPDYLKVMKPLTQILIMGLLLMTLTGVIWLVLGYGFSNTMIVKLFFVGAVWISGLVIDNITEPGFRKLAPVQGQEPSQAFIQAQKKHLILEVFATLLFYIIIFIGVIL